MRKQKALTIHLIKEELKNKYLMYSLQSLGFDCSLYLLDISHVVLEFAGFKEVPDGLYNCYLCLIDKALDEIKYSNLQEMAGRWAETIYKELKQYECQSGKGDCNTSQALC